MYRFVLAIILLWGCIVSTFAQKMDDATRFASTITVTDLQRHLSIIASDEMQGRETGTEGQRKAAEYIEGQFKHIGLNPTAQLGGYQQLYPLYRDSLLSSFLKIGDKGLVLGTDYIFALNNTYTNMAKGKMIVYVGYGISTPTYDDYAGKDVKGKVVLLFLGEPKTNGIYLATSKSRPSEWTFPGLELKLQTAKQKGAIAALIISPTLESFSPRNIASAQKTNLYYPRTDSKPTVNGVSLSHNAGRNLIGTVLFDSLIKKAKASERLDEITVAPSKTKVVLDINKDRQQVDASNVIGVIEGTDKKDEFVFLTGHYDHLGMRDGKIYYGADDDGSGTCAVLEMAEAFAKAKAEGKGPRRTIVFMTVSGEEKGLWGSEYYCDNPVFPLDKTTVDLNTDMVGRIDPNRKYGDSMNYVYVIGHDKLSSDLPLINEGVNRQYTKLELDYKYDDPKDPERIYYRSDHYNFARKGVPILFFFNGVHRDYHRPTDTIDKINWSLYEKRVQMIFYTAWEMANRDEMLKRDIPLPELTR